MTSCTGCFWQAQQRRAVLPVGAIAALHANGTGAFRPPSGQQPADRPRPAAELPFPHDGDRRVGPNSMARVDVLPWSMARTTMATWPPPGEPAIKH